MRPESAHHLCARWIVFAQHILPNDENRSGGWTRYPGSERTVRIVYSHNVRLHPVVDLNVSPAPMLAFTVAPLPRSLS